MNNRSVWILFFLTLGVAGVTFFVFPDALIVYTICWLIVTGLALWRGNRMIWRILDRRFPWGEYGKRRFFIHLVLGYLLSIAILNFSYLLIRFLITDSPPEFEQVVTTNVIGLILFVPIFSMYFSLQFLNFWRKTQLDMEQYQKESIRSELRNLKNHLDPHFLFNNLNILSSLIDIGPGPSKQFLTRFAKVYRKMLQTSAEDLVSLDEELDFIESYNYLLETRFGEAIRFDFEIDNESRSLMLPPLTLQMLIENAVKHNIASEEKPLVIHVKSVGPELSISNSVNVKPEDEATRSGTGLKNIKDRIAYFSDNEMSVNHRDDEFIVTIPLIEIEEL